MKASKKTIKKTTRLAEQKRAKIKRAAVKLFSINGYVATTIRQIASAASIEGGSFYDHFTSKMDLLESIFDEGNNLLLEAATAALDDSSLQPKEAFRQLIYSHLKIVEFDQDQFIVVTRELQRLTGRSKRNIMNQRDRYELLFRQTLKAGIQEGCFRRCDVKLISFGVIGLLNGVAYWYNPKGSITISDIAEEYTNLLMRGLTTDGNSNETVSELVK